jgi:hypothetical protein
VPGEARLEVLVGRARAYKVDDGALCVDDDGIEPLPSTQGVHHGAPERRGCRGVSSGVGWEKQRQRGGRLRRA